ncbi:MAG: methylmalonyl Co-A mutase-associated GTPase MeaB [Chitinophagales bacterium]|nr:methylmalonyl Co-A mutase-associated GTPase MeaB [Chitinophagaceae bacterium]MCB9064965.1 methylmalonyl Co-A mutase-associated GTPase MeaB [Chitinophagales bacterium]
MTQLLEDIQAGSYKALARGITIVENEIAGYEELLQSLPNNTTNNVVGITGPPGAGKSTLVSALLQFWTSQNKKVAVIAVDPSSPFNYGALLGDRIRMNEFYNNENVYIRSLASRGALGGLSKKIIEITDVVRQGMFDIILVETVGVGQSEVEIAGLADCTIVTLVPEAGDEIQTLKAGIMEIADIFIINKADRDAADALYANLRIMAHERANGDKDTPVLKTIATKKDGIEEAATAIESHLNNSERATTKRVQLLTEKCWHLIQSARMKDIDKQGLKQEISNTLDQQGFNIYLLAKKFS